MAAKRFLDDHSGTDQNRLSDKRMRNTPSFASVIKEVVMINSIANFCSSLEPLLRRVVNEEVDRGIRRALVLSRSPSLRIQAIEPSNLQLVFSKELSQPIFTGSKILDIENNPLQVFLVDTSNQQNTIVPSPIKIELVVLDGDFQPAGDPEATWTREDFYKKIVKERAGKRPLIAGEVNLTMRDGIVTVGDLEFTDNSSWIRSRRFRIGAKVANGSFEGSRVREAISETFVVRDHRGELYMKRHPPALSDEVWRLEKIGKNGAFHRKLSEKGIRTVQDFLKLSVVDPRQLKAILGIGMSDRMWEMTIKHAKTCVMGSKSYILRAPCSSNNVFYFNPICQVVKAMVNGQLYSSRDINGILNKGYVDHLVKQAYATWDSLQQVDESLSHHVTPMLAQGELLANYQLRQTTFPADRCIIAPTSNEHVGSSHWMTNNPSYYGTPQIDSDALFNPFVDSPPDGGDLSPSRSYIGGV